MKFSILALIILILIGIFLAIFFKTKISTIPTIPTERTFLDYWIIGNFKLK